MASRQDHRRAQGRRSVFDMLADAAGGLGSGVVQGASLGAGDELFGNQMDIAGSAHRAPVAFSLGSAIGALPWAALGARATAGATKGPLSRLLASTALGAVHGGAAGLFGMSPGDMTDSQRAQEAAGMALFGGAVGGGSVPAIRASMDLADNLPAIMGRQRAEDGSITQAGLGRGTRKSAPMNVRLAGDGDPDARAELALRLGLNMDEFDALQGNARGKLNRYGDDFQASGPNMGRSVRSLVDYAAQSPGGSQRLNAQADDMLGGQVRQAADSARLPRRGPKAGGTIPQDTLDGFLAAADRPEYHQSWLRAVKTLPQRQRFQLAQAMVERMRMAAATLGPQEARAAMAEPQFLKKLDALGVGLDTAALGRRAAAPAQALRDRATPRENPDFGHDMRGFSNVEDRFLARSGSLSEADALALLDAAAKPRNAFFVEPRRPGDHRLLTGEYEHGVKFGGPRSYFGGDDSRRNFNLGLMDLDASPTELAILASQPLAALLHGAPHWGDRRDG